MLAIRTRHNFKIKLSDGRIYDMADDLSILIQSFNAGYPEFETKYQARPKHGLLDYGGRYEQRNIKVTGVIMGASQHGVEALRQHVFQVMNTMQPFEIFSNKNKGKVYTKCKLASPIDYTEDPGAMIPLDFEIIDANPFALSEYDTLAGITDTNKFPLGTKVDLSKNPAYTFDTNTFSIYNFGDEEIDPRIDDLLIDYVGPSSFLKIENLSTGEAFQHNGTTSSLQSLKLDKLRVTKSGLSVYGDTNRKAIKLKPGKNDFKLTGTTNPFTISFKFRFKYLA